MENIVLNKNRIVSRTFVPVTVQSRINRVDVPESMWIELENLQQDWCDHPPSFVSDGKEDANFGVTFQCGRLRNPIYLISPSQLPTPLRDLIELVPSPGQR